ncbi:MAG TPA: hypothetical protein VLA88_06195 [Candidatus Saccharimonadales bacterium]|nr:hypothetical protein [Candidatus Saccharimonadales bacterium]
MARRTWAIVNVVISLAVLAGGLWAFWNIQSIVDWWRLMQYKPAAAIVQLANETTMIGRGRDMFYVSDPQIEARDAFNQHCSDHGAGEQGAVLGCYVRQSIYIFNVNDPRLPGVKEVTAAHEMLHAVYDRLDKPTKDRLNALLQAEFDKRKDDADLQEVVALYQKTEPGELLNEMHSILATEYTGLSPELETYYKQYFTDRQKVVSYAQGYKQVFKDSKTRVENYQKQLDALKQQIDTNNAQLKNEYAAIQSESLRLDALRHSDPATYNQQVSAYNARVTAYNNHIKTTQALVNQYNAIIPKIKSEVALQADLNNSLDSNYQPVSPN